MIIPQSKVARVGRPMRLGYAMEQALQIVKSHKINQEVRDGLITHTGVIRKPTFTSAASLGLLNYQRTRTGALKLTLTPAGRWALEHCPIAPPPKRQRKRNGRR